VGELTEEQKREIDDLARQMPNWQKHLADFRKRHPELSPQEVMKKAGFTFRMKKGKLVTGFVRRIFKRIAEEVMRDESPISSG